MEGASYQQLQAIRPQEIEYEREIRTAYKDHLQLFVTHCSDLLHLDVGEKQWEGKTYKCLLAKSPFQKYDILLEVRGSVISYEKLKRVVQEGRVHPHRLPLLLYLNHQLQLLLSPKNIAKYLFTHPALQSFAPLPISNCYIQSHFGSKLLVIAGRDISAGEQLVVEPKSYCGSVYRFDASEF